MKRIIIAIGLMFCVVCVMAQKNVRLLYADKGSNGKYGIIDTSGKIIVTHQYDAINRLVSENISGNEFFRTKLNGKYGIIDKYGKVVIDPLYDEITLRSQSSDWIETKLNGKYGFADFYWSEQPKRYVTIKEIFPPIYDMTFYSGGESAPSGFIRVKLNNKWGLVDEISGKEITGMKYDEVSDFYFYQAYDWCVVKLNNKYGMIDKTGKEVIPCKYDEVVSIEGDSIQSYRIKVRIGSREFYIDKTGKEVK